jgi:hypothetical protein
VVVSTLSAALYVHQRRVSTTAEFFQDANAQPTVGLPNLYLSGSSPTKHPAWEDPVAVVLVVAGFGSAAGIVKVRRQAA